jgi:uncharacterized protein (DUF1499 family)
MTADDAIRYAKDYFGAAESALAALVAEVERLRAEDAELREAADAVATRLRSEYRRIGRTQLGVAARNREEAFRTAEHIVRTTFKLGAGE